MSLWLLKNIHLVPSCTLHSYHCLASHRWTIGDWGKNQQLSIFQFIGYFSTHVQPHLARVQEVIEGSKMNELQGSPSSKISQLQFWAHSVRLDPPICLGVTFLFGQTDFKWITKIQILHSTLFMLDCRVTISMTFSNLVLEISQSEGSIAIFWKLEIFTVRHCTLKRNCWRYEDEERYVYSSNCLICRWGKICSPEILDQW